MNKPKVLLIGSGGIGVRHLQGLLTSAHPLAIQVLDLNAKALLTAQEIANSSPKKNLDTSVTYTQQMPQESVFDMVIVATASMSRAAVLCEFLSHNKVACLVLEKFLFPNFADYQRIASLLSELNILTYVNCPRRMNPSYAELKTKLAGSSQWQMKVSGSAWGMACNSVHLLDLYHYLFSPQQPITLTAKGLLPEVYQSKRNGYLEVNGVLSTTDEQLQIRCQHGEQISLQVTITDHKETFVIDEINGTITHVDHDNQTTAPFAVVYQSTLSGQLIDRFIERGDTLLTPFSESADIHLSLMHPLAEHFAKYAVDRQYDCPIT